MRRHVSHATLVVAVLAMVHVPGTAVGMTKRDLPTRVAQDPVQSPSGASTFLSRIIRLLAANDYAAAWARLDPAQQRLVPQGAYVRCENASPIPGRLARITAVRTERTHVVVPGLRLPSRAAIAVTFRLTFELLPAEAPVVTSVRAHALGRDGAWTWMLSSQRLALHRSGRCGQATPTVGRSM
jgi:hypothetical protein